MKVLLATSHFYPESFKANDMAFELSRRGHDVTVLTPIPDYPQGKFFDGYGIFKRRREKINNVTIIRTLVVPRHKGTPFWLGINYLTYTIFSSLKAFWLGISKRYDSIIVHETSPIMVGIPAIIIKKLNRIKSHFWVLDLWPESLTAAGGIKNNLILGIFKKLSRWIYHNSDTIMISSNGFKKSILNLGEFGYKVKYFPNWVDEIEYKPLENPFSFPKGFNVVFTGNIGEAQDMNHILECAKQLQASGINIILVGDGRKRDYALSYIEQHGLANVFLPGAFAREYMNYFYDNADILLMSLKNEPVFALTVPAKLQTYMSSGKPVVAMINGEGADLIEEADCGWAVPAEDSKALAELLSKLSKEDKTVLERKGENGKLFAEKHFNFKKCMDNLEEIISCRI